MIILFVFLLQLTVIVYDSVYPNSRDTSTVTINVDRNPSGPVFQSPQYSETIPASYELGQSILQVSARDDDGVSLLIISFKIKLIS